MSEIFSQFGYWSIVDIALIAVAIYHILLLIRGTRTAQMLTGILIVLVAFIASSFVPLTTVNWVLNKFYSSIILIIIILFQEDIRLALSRIGKKPLIYEKEAFSSSRIIDELSGAATALATKKIGALIVLERSIILSRYIDIGVLIDGQISKELIISLFHPSSPVHDGAVIVQRGRIAAAGCFLPLTRKEKLAQSMGTRHRAALGISQETDAAVIIVSEERGTVALVLDGTFHSVTETRSLQKLLKLHLVDKAKYLEALGSTRQTARNKTHKNKGKKVK
jgi:diadenylate cyclase